MRCNDTTSLAIRTRYVIAILKWRFIVPRLSCRFVRWPARPTHLRETRHGAGPTGCWAASAATRLSSSLSFFHWHHQYSDTCMVYAPCAAEITIALLRDDIVHDHQQLIQINYVNEAILLAKERVRREVVAKMSQIIRLNSCADRHEKLRRILTKQNMTEW